VELSNPTLGPDHFQRISDLLHRQCGISLHDGKQALVRARLVKRLIHLGFGGFDQYLRYLEADASGVELRTMVDVLTTNKTSFFREPQHFAFLRSEVLPREWRGRDGLRIWSAGCSTGEEPYSLAITLREELPDVDRRDPRILATDISTRVLERARAAEYDLDALADVPPPIMRRHFHRAHRQDGHYQVVEPTRALVRLARLNLLAQWPMRGPFDAIFCRNVMIYFDAATRQQLVGRFWRLLRPGGYLFLGGAESLSGVEHEFEYVQPAIFRRADA
jgi:chemotaxis protein methyltransferase CheR